MNKLAEIVGSFRGKKIGVIGDLMLDQYIFGDTKRISPEAPVPVVLAERESFIPGGASNTANNIASLGGNVFVIGLIGTDLAGRQVINQFKRRGIDAQGIFQDKRRPTIQKIRIIARGQQLVRVDRENCDYIDIQQQKKVVDFIANQIKNWDGLVISDYTKGLITKNLAEKIIRLARKYKKPIIVDTKPRHTSFFKNITLITPNYEEAIEMAKIQDLKKAGRKIQKQLNCNVLITQGSQGMTLFEKDRIRYFLPKTKQVKKAFNVAGAGDTVVAALSLSLASGVNLEKSVEIANYAAGIVVKKKGTATVSLPELEKSLGND